MKKKAAATAAMILLATPLLSTAQEGGKAPLNEFEVAQRLWQKDHQHKNWFQRHPALTVIITATGATGATLLATHPWSPSTQVVKPPQISVPVLPTSPIHVRPL